MKCVAATNAAIAAVETTEAKVPIVMATAKATSTATRIARTIGTTKKCSVASVTAEDAICNREIRGS